MDRGSGVRCVVLAMEGSRMSSLGPALLIHHSRFSPGGTSGTLALGSQEEEKGMDTRLRDRESRVESRTWSQGKVRSGD